MPLRNAHLALVERHKVLEYLLNAAHPDNGGKAQFFKSLGFIRENAELLFSHFASSLRPGKSWRRSILFTARNVLLMAEYRRKLRKGASRWCARSGSPIEVLTHLVW